MLYFGIFGIVWILIFAYGSAQRNSERDGDGVEFKSRLYTEVYRLSFIAPFKWFVEDDRNLTPKGIDIQRKLRFAEYTNRFTVRSFMAYKVLLMLLALLMSGLTIFVMDNLAPVMHVMLNMDVTETAASIGLQKKLMITMGYLVVSMIPNFRLNQKTKSVTVLRTRDLPMIQMFTILMLRSNKTVSEILFALSKLNTYHRKTFERGYRIYCRNKREGMAYLRSQFDSERFIEMFNSLEDIAEYAREECIQIMESNMKSLVDEINGIKRKNDLSRLLYSQASMVVPFAAIIFLGAAPLVISGMSNFSGAIFPG